MSAQLLISDGSKWLPMFPAGDPVIVDPPPATDVAVTLPAANANVTGDVYPEVTIAPSVGATAVVFKIGHIDFGTYPAARVGTSNVWRATTPWKSNLSLYDRVTALTQDYAFWIQAQVTTPTGAVKSPHVQLYSNNYPVTGAIPGWDPGNAFTSAMPSYDDTGTLNGTIAAFYASFDGVYGSNNNPDGNPPASIISAPTATGTMVRVVMPDDHTTADQANAGLRWQCQTPATLTDGTIAWIGYSYRIPVATSGAAGTISFPIPTSSHISIAQCMGAEPGASPGSYGRGLRIMYHARTIAGNPPVGTSDMVAGNFNTDQTDRGHGEPALAIAIPFNRGQVTDVVWGLGVSKDPRKGWLEFRYRLGPGPLIRYEFFGIAGLYRIPCALIAPNGLGQRWDQHLYRARGKWAQVSMDFGQLIIAATPEAVDPHSYPDDSPVDRYATAYADAYS